MTPPDQGSDEAVFHALEHSQPPCLEFTIKGTLDLFSYERLKTMVTAWRKGERYEDVVFDFKNTSYMGSAGWAVVFQAATETKRRKGVCIVHSMNDAIHRSLR